jgi:hypothetical protein
LGKKLFVSLSLPFRESFPLIQKIHFLNEWTSGRIRGPLEPVADEMHFWTMHFGNKFAKTDKNNIGPQMLQKITFL